MHLLKAGVDLRGKLVLTSAIEISEGARPALASLALPASLKWTVVKCPIGDRCGKPHPSSSEGVPEAPSQYFSLSRMKRYASWWKGVGCWAV